MVEIVETAALMRPIAHFSHAARLDDVIFVGATAGTDADRQLAGSTPGRTDFGAQACRMFENLALALDLLGAGLDDVVQLKTYLVDLRDLSHYRELFAARFGAAPPSHAVAGSWLFPLPQAMVELDAIAVVGGVRSRIAAPGLALLPSGCPTGGILAGRQLFVTAVPLASDGSVAAGDPAAQSRQVMANLAQALRASGLGLDRVCRLHVGLADLRVLPAFDAAVRGAMTAPFPARTVLAAALERSDMLVQVEAIVALDGFRPVGVASQALGPASPAVVVGETFYSSAHTGPGTHDPEAQSEGAWTAIEALMREASIAPGQVLRTNNALSHWHDFAAFNAAYGSHVAWPYPPRTTVLGASSAAQIEVIAHRRAEQARILQVALEKE